MKPTAERIDFKPSNKTGYTKVTQKQVEIYKTAPPLSDFFKSLEHILPAMYHSAYRTFNEDFVGSMYQPRFHSNAHEIVFVVKGNGIMMLNGRDIEYRTGDVIIVSPGDLHIHDFPGNLNTSSNTINLHFSFEKKYLVKSKKETGTQLPEMDRQVLDFVSQIYPVNKVLHFSLNSELFNRVIRFWQEYAQNKNSQNILCRIMLLEIIVILSREFYKKEKDASAAGNVKAERIREVAEIKNYIDNNYSEAISINRMYEKLAADSDHLRTILKEYTI